MPNVLNPETESITLNTKLETPELEPATELEQPSYESTSNPETAIAVETTALDADAPTELAAEAAPAAELAPEVPAAATSVTETQTAQPALVDTVAAAEPEAHADHFMESAEDFSAALEAFEREQAAEAAAVEAYGDKIVSGTVIKQTEKHLVIDVGLKSEGLVPLEQVLDHTGAVKFQPGDVIEVVIEKRRARRRLPGQLRAGAALARLGRDREGRQRQEPGYRHGCQPRQGWPNRGHRPQGLFARLAA